jgi:hypothetical protein
LRPSEIRVLQWADYNGEDLNIKRGVWCNIVGETKTEDSAASVLAIEPLRRLLQKLRHTVIGEAHNGCLVRMTDGLVTTFH